MNRSVERLVPQGSLLLVYFTEASERTCSCVVSISEDRISAKSLVKALWANHAPLRKFPIIRYSGLHLGGTIRTFCLLEQSDNLSVVGLGYLHICLCGEGGGPTWVEEYLQAQCTLPPFEENTPCPPLFESDARKDQALAELRNKLSFVPAPFESLFGRFSKDGWNGPCNNMVLHGPPGTGKSYQVKALFDVLIKFGPPGRVCKLFLEAASALNEKYFGESEKRIRSWGQIAATNPTILYLVGLEEVHTLAKKQQASKTNEGGGADATANMITMLLHLAQEYHNILFISTTNFVDALDEAFMRADRVEFSLLVPISTQAERRTLLLAPIRMQAREIQVQFPNLDRVVGLTTNFSFAQISTLKRKWSELALKNDQALNELIAELGEREMETRSITRRLLSRTGDRRDDMTTLVDMVKWNASQHHILFPSRGVLSSILMGETKSEQRDDWKKEGWVESILKTSASQFNAVYIIDGEFHLNYGGERAWPALKRILDQCAALGDCLVMVEWEAAIGLHFSSLSITPNTGNGNKDVSNTFSVSDSHIFDALTAFIIQAQQLSKAPRVLEVYWSKEHHVLTTLSAQTGVKFDPATHAVLNN
ncbi:hypothetical protein BASA81_001681 [Batrachochytrium salamandrivorans]|nr:hypothetical protein BASA81_001681 [Batrachochytrium salamandrivorans]